MLRADTARLIGHLVTDQPAARHGGDACRVCGLALSTSILLAPLDPAVSKTNYRPHHPTAASKSARINDRMRISAGETVPSRSDNSAYGTPANTDASATGPSLLIVDERYGGALDEGPIVDQPHQDAGGQPQSLTAAQTDPLPRLGPATGGLCTSSNMPRTTPPSSHPGCRERLVCRPKSGGVTMSEWDGWRSRRPRRRRPLSWGR